MYEKIYYKKPFIKEVILRLDFPSPLPNLDKSIPQSISRKALLKFPNLEPQKTHSQQFKISGAKVLTSSTETMQWVFHDDEREKTLIISPTSVVQTVKKYKTYEIFLENIKGILSEFYTVYKDLSVNRIGLRYINIIDPGGSNPLAWADFIDKKILKTIDFHKDKNNMTRAFHVFEYNFDGQAVKYQFGIANPDYPAVIKRKEFVLDIDSYFNGAFELPETLDNLNKAHEKIQEIFEKSITKKTRNLMRLTSND
jgi:uncharacterized protein (TIGR04255 family)